MLDFPQGIELLGCARAMDGKADLRWRVLERTSNQMDSDQQNNWGPQNEYTNDNMVCQPIKPGTTIILFSKLNA